MTQTDHEGSINFNPYREEILVAYDWRNAKILYTNVEAIFGADIDRVSRALATIRDSVSKWIKPFVSLAKCLVYFPHRIK
jgi:hypothetical protein